MPSDGRFSSGSDSYLSRATRSGQANCVNWKAMYRSKEKDWILQLGDGSQRMYSKQVKLDNELKRRMRFPTQHVYLLTKEIKPNGNQLLFSYQWIHERPRIVQVKALNRIGETLDELHFSYAPDGCHVTNLSDETVRYVQSEEACLSSHISTGHFADRKMLKKVVSSQKGDTFFCSSRIIE